MLETRYVSTGPHDFPWMAALVYESSNPADAPQIFCGGVILSSNVVMTAAHCLSEVQGYSLKKIRIGHAQLSSEESFEVEIVDIKGHPEYKTTATGVINDIALLKLKQSLKFTPAVKPVCLPTSKIDESILSNANTGQLQVVGWGKTSERSEDKQSDNLQMLNISYVQTDDCEDRFQKILQRKNKSATFELLESRMCAQGIPDSDACNGDSGGPLLRLDIGSQIYQAIGVVSFGTRRCDSSTPGVYTRVTEFLPWIKNYMFKSGLE